MAVLFKTLGGSLEKNVTLSTTKPAQFFTGTLPVNAVSAQVSLFGQSFQEGTDSIAIDGSTFTIPNPSTYPNGLSLLDGKNEIKVRAVLSNGVVTDTSTLTAYLIQNDQLGTLFLPPSGVEVEKLDAAVKIWIPEVTPSDTRYSVLGYNIYAATNPGGGSTGYFQVNPERVTLFEESSQEVSLGTLNVTAALSTDGSGELLADPLYIQFSGEEQNSAGSKISSLFSERLEIPESVRDIKTTVSVKELKTNKRFYFVHDRNADLSSDNPAIPNSEFNALAEDEPLYYVVTAVYYDPSNQEEIESFLSAEYTGYPLRVSTNIASLPLVSRQQLVQDVSASIYRSNDQIQLQAGSYLRDTFIDPASTEMERVRFIVDFMHQSLSFSTLLDIDDPNRTNESTPVSTSAYKTAVKQAFFLESDEDTQELVDMMFEQLAIKWGVTRLPGVASIGTVTFFTKRRPDRSIPIPLGTTVFAGSVSFRTTQAGEISINSIASFFDPSTGRYSVSLPIEAVDVGVDGDVEVNQINRIDPVIPGLSVTNAARTFGGKGEETNLELAQRASATLTSVDSGTKAGYEQTALGVGGVEEAFVVDANSTYRVESGNGVGVWVKGSNFSTVSDAFAFSFENKRDVQFVVVDDPQDLKFRAEDVSITEENPILEVLDDASIGYEFRNLSTSKVLDLTDVSVLDYRTIQLSSSYNDPLLISVSDIFVGDVRFRTSKEHIFTRQPVVDIESLIGEVSGEVDPSLYDLYKLEDPLVDGESSKSSDSLRLTEPSSNPDAVTIPSGDSITVTGEEHIFLADTNEYLFKLGVHEHTIQIFNLDRTIQYTRPDSSTGTPDFTIVSGTSTSPVGISLTDNTTIPVGDTILIDYVHDENFSVRYNINSLLQFVQDKIDQKKHVLADAQVHNGINNSIDYSGTIVLRKGVSPQSVDALLRTELVNYTESQGFGGKVSTSAFISLIERTEGVAQVLTPTKLTYTPNSLRVREQLSSQLSTLVDAWSTPTVSVFLISDALQFSTDDGGGSSTVFRGVYQNNDLLSLLNIKPSGNTVDSSGSPLNDSSNQAYIIGKDGMVIQGISDDTTLDALSPYSDPTLKAEWIVQQRRLLTANKILVSLEGGLRQQVDVLSLNGVVAFPLTQRNVREDSVVVTTLDGSTTYQTNVDYVLTVGLEDEITTVRRVAGGSIPDLSKVQVTYLFHDAIKRPQDDSYYVTYRTSEALEDEVKTIQASEIEYLTAGVFEFQWREEG
jgi:hypothetical protein